MTDLVPKQPLMPHPAVGSRVGAVQSADDDFVYLYGYGERVEDSVPSESTCGAVARECRKHQIRLPTILLDSGVRVWGCECHWAAEQSIRNWIGERHVITVYPRRSTHGAITTPATGAGEGGKS